MEIVDKRQAILQAAAKQFSTYGFHETKVEQIAEEAGVAKGTVYLYFKDKNTLLFEVARYNMQLYLEGMRETTAPYETAGDKLRAYARHQVARFPDMARFHKLNFEHFIKVKKDENLLESIREDQRAILNEVAAIIRYGVERGEFREVDTFDVAVLFSGALQHYVNSMVIGLVDQKTGTDAEAMVDLLIQGLGRK